MVIGSHNAWSYLKPRKWWMKPFVFMSKCQSYDIRTQYEQYDVRCFDLRLRFDKNGNPTIVHGAMAYNITPEEIEYDLRWLDDKKDCIVRVLLDTRTKKQYSEHQKQCYINYCSKIEQLYPNIQFTCGRNLYNWNVDYNFKDNITIEELYSSVCPPKIIDDWYPWMYAKLNNKKNISKGTDKDVLLIDFVNVR